MGLWGFGRVDNVRNDLGSGRRKKGRKGARREEDTVHIPSWLSRLLWWYRMRNGPCRAGLRP